MFTLFGFDVKIRNGFLFFLALIMMINPNAFGVWLAAALAGFTLLHEFGHALAARSAGAQAAISLDFMAGYTSFRPTKPLTRPQRAMISVAGPAIQIAVSVAVLAAMGVNPLSRDSALRSEAAYAIWWAGPVIGALNLIPVLPLDGGHLAQTAVEAVLRRPALREMAILSLVLTAGAAVAMAVFGHSDFTLFIAFLLIGQFGLVQATSPQHRAKLEGAMQHHGALLHPGSRPSAWQLAHAAVQRGDDATARRLILDDLTNPTPAAQYPAAWPANAPPEAIRAIIETLPTDLPSGNPASEAVLIDALFKAGFARQAGEHAAVEFGKQRRPVLAAAVARAATRMGDGDNAVQWLNAAVDAAQYVEPVDRAVLAALLDHAPELEPLRPSPAFIAARSRLQH